ncbi:MAG: sensor histidine kinase, partial [Gammaproteobacteria bacterium]
AYLYPAREAQPVIELELDDRISDIAADEVRMRQLLHNLIRNALEALDGQASGCVTLSTDAIDSDSVELQVADNGPGFDPETVDNVFEPYVTTKAKGTGLGLSIVKKLVDEHGGTVVAENRAGGGAIVRVRMHRQNPSGISGSDRQRNQQWRQHA